MIREIKFKAKRLDNREWVEGTPICINGKPYGIMIGEKESPDIDPSTVCQFTGLTDCQGKEIWEGDILQDVDYDNFKYVVIYAEGTFLAQKEGLYTGIPLHECIGDSGNVTYAKVVGNKFDKEK